MNKGNNLFSKPCRLEMSISVISVSCEVNGAENVVDLLHCFAPHPLKLATVPDGYISSENGLLAANADIVDPILSAAGA